MDQSTSISHTDPNRTQKITVLPDGTTRIDWVTVSFSEFLIEYVLSKEDREMHKKYGNKLILCG